MGRLVKVMKYELRYLEGCGSFSGMQQILWELQNKTREVLNRTIQMSAHWDYLDRDRFERTGEHLDIVSETGKKRLDGYIYDQLKDQYRIFASANFNATIQRAWKKYKDTRKDALSGLVSLPSYKRDQPLLINKGNVKIKNQEQDVVADLTVLSTQYGREHEVSTHVVFAVKVNDKTQRSIIERVLSNEYGVGECQLVYERPKWFLLLTYSFEAKKTEVDPMKILGIDLGETMAVCASIFGEGGSLQIAGGEVTKFARSIEARRRSMQKQAAVCGDGRRGHGTKTRVEDVYKLEHKIENFRKTINHRYSRAVIDYAIKNGCGTIQMEDLTGIKDSTGAQRFLRHWTYFDLQTKIKAKASEYGISVVMIEPRYTSQRCSKCGCIDKGNRTSQERFCCVKCGFTANADYNASQNISIKGIESIIQKTIGADQE